MVIRALVLLVVLGVSSSIAPSRTSAQDPPMMMYQMVFLRSGPNTTPLVDAEKMQGEHLAKLAKMNKDRINLLYGPFLDRGDMRGIAILDVRDADAAKKAFADDPFVKSGHMVADVKMWYGQKGWFSLPSEPPTPEHFVLGFFLRGDDRSELPPHAQELQKLHLAYMDDLRTQGKIVVAGPFGGDSDMRGLVIYRVKTVDEAKQLAAGDPAVKAGRLVLSARPWMTFKGIIK